MQEPERLGSAARRFAKLLATLSCSLLALHACSVDSQPRISEWSRGEFRPVAVESHALTGRRDGAVTTATAVFDLADGGRLQVELEFHYDPTPTLRSGRWSQNAGEAFPVRAESVEFVGGQGEGPSVGGVFLLERNGASAYRLELPLQPVADRGWDVDA